MEEKRPALQAWQVREAVKQFPGSNVRRLSVLTLIPRAVFHRRLIELERLGFVAQDDNGHYHTIPILPEDFPELPEGTQWSGTSSTP
jgi:hypothetical protein